MKKMPCVFVRDFSDKRKPVLTTDVTPGCEWVLAGEGEATRKWDGTAALIKDGEIWARYDCKRGKTPPEGALPCDPAPDETTGHWPHWVKVVAQPEYQWHREAFDQWVRWHGSVPSPGTYEVVGPKVNGNPEHEPEHRLRVHGEEGYGHIDRSPRTQDSIRALLEQFVVEGLVFHHPDGRMAKIRRADFGLPWPVTFTGVHVPATPSEEA